MHSAKDSEKKDPNYWLVQPCTSCGQPVSTYKMWKYAPMVPYLIRMLHWVECQSCGITNWMEDPDVPRR